MRENRIRCQIKQKVQVLCVVYLFGTFCRFTYAAGCKSIFLARAVTMDCQCKLKWTKMQEWAVQQVSFKTWSYLNLRRNFNFVLDCGYGLRVFIQSSWRRLYWVGKDSSNLQTNKDDPYSSHIFWNIVGILCHRHLRRSAHSLCNC